MKYGTPLRTCLNSAQRKARKERTSEVLAGISFVLITMAAMYGFLLAAVPA